MRDHRDGMDPTPVDITERLRAMTARRVPRRVHDEITGVRPGSKAAGKVLKRRAHAGHFEVTPKSDRQRRLEKPPTLTRIDQDAAIDWLQFAGPVRLPEP
jgi:hypothetical protein